MTPKPVAVGDDYLEGFKGTVIFVNYSQTLFGLIDALS